MANQTIAQLINEIDSKGAIMINKSLMKRNGVLATAQSYLCNHHFAHKYSVWNTLPTAGIRSIYDGVANSNVTSSTTTVNMTPFATNFAQEKDLVVDLATHYTTYAPMYFESLAQTVQKGYIYGTNASFGYTGYAGTGWHQYITTNKATQQVKNFQTTASATGCSSIFAVRYSYLPNMDGAALVTHVDNTDGAFYVNPDWIYPITITGNTGPYQGYQMYFKMNSTFIMPGTKNIAAIRGIQTGSTITTDMVDDMLDAVNATTDGSTIIYVNSLGRSKLNSLKDGNLVISPDNFGYDIRVFSFNGIPVVVDDNMSKAETGALYGLS